MNIILIGLGNVGKELHKVLIENAFQVDCIVKSSGIYDKADIKVDEKENISKYINEKSFVFISTPSKGKGEEVSMYYEKSIEAEAKVITCEKAFIAYNWEVVRSNERNIKYSATVGGGTGMLKHITEFKGNIQKIEGVINGTLNYIGNRLVQGLSEDEVFKEVSEKGIAEPGSHSFTEVIVPN